MCQIKPVKHYFFSPASIAEWLVLQTDSHTARVRVSWAAKHFRQMHAKINILYTVLVLNIENVKLNGQVDSVYTELNRESKSYVFFSMWSLYCIYESVQGKIIYDWIFIIIIKFTIMGADIDDGRQWLTTNSRRIIANDCTAFFFVRPPAISTFMPRLTE